MEKPEAAELSTRLEPPTFRRAVWVWIKIGLLSFGGPAGQIALMHRELVEKRRWVSNGRFLHALNYCMLLPGPEAQQLAIYVGWLLHRTWGGIVAGALFVLPGAILMWGISVVYVLFGKVPAVDAVFYGLKPAVMAIVVAAVLRIGKKALRNRLAWAVAGVSFGLIFFLNFPFPLIILGAALVGLIGMRWFPDALGHAAGHGHARDESSVVGDGVSVNLAVPTVVGTIRKIAFWGALWLFPVIACVAILGWNHVLVQQGLFFSKAAVVTFGGAYAVLPYVAQQAVETHGWVTAAQMMDGLALAETTPGPLILVLQFVGFLGGWSANSVSSPMLTATLAAMMTSWVTFIPGFLFIFAGAPYIERTRGNLRLNAALSAVTAAVVGVVLNLAVWFAWHVVLPESGRYDIIAVCAAIFFFIALQRWKWDVLLVIGVGGMLGLIVWGVGLI